MSPASPASEDKDCRVAPDTSPVHHVSPSSLRQGPKSSTGSARMPLSQVTAFNTGSLTVIGSLDRGLVPKLRSCYSPFVWSSGTSSRKKQRLCSYLKSTQPARCFGFVRSAWSSGIGAPIFHCRLCGFDRHDLPVAPWCRGADVHPWMGVGLLEAVTVYRDNHSRGSMLTTVMRSVSSDYIRSVAQRAMRTREGKGRHRGFVLFVRRRYQRTMGVWCWWVRPLRGVRFGGQTTETLMLP